MASAAPAVSAGCASAVSSILDFVIMIISVFQNLIERFAGFLQTVQGIQKFIQSCPGARSVEYIQGFLYGFLYLFRLLQRQEVIV